MSNLFIVRSPLQLINCIEAIEYFNLQDNILLIIYNNTPNTNIQLEKIAKLYPWKKIIRVNQEIKKSKFFDYILLIYKLKKIKYNYLVLGDLGSIYKIIIANIHKNEVWHVDDGVGTINQYNKILIPNKLNKPSLKLFRFLFVGLKIKIKDDIHLFTYFNLKPFRNSRVIQNHLSFFQKKYLKSNIINEDIYLLGQPLVETNLLKNENYITYIKNVISSTDKKIIYIPHRTEQENNELNLLTNEKFKINNINMPIELFFLEQSITPSHIISFMTTAFFTLKLFYPKCLFQSIYIPSDLILERKDDIENAYKFIDKIKVERI